MAKSTVKIANDDAAGWRREARKQRKALQDLTNTVLGHIAAMEGVMALPSSVDRGKAIARLLNRLEMANDRVRYFALDVDFRKDLAKARSRGLSAPGRSRTRLVQG